MGSVFISYSHDSPEHRDRMLALSDRLRADGIDCFIDQYELAPAKGWPRWCSDQIKAAQFVLVACTETYLRRFEANEDPGLGLGGTWEGHHITQDLYTAQGRNLKFIPITFSREDSKFIPTELQSAPHYLLFDGYEQLYRRLTAQHDTPAPALGSIKAMPARERKQDFQTLWRVPYQRNRFFTGREQTLIDLRQALETRKAAALSGMGGMGKTQTSIEYAYRHQSDYKAIFWLRAEKRDTLLTDYAAIAEALNLPSAQAQKQELIINDVKRWLETNSGWLLIFDNADDLALAREFIPQWQQGHILLTTRARATGSLAERILLEEMPEHEAVDLLLRGSGSASDHATALEVADELGYLPLALDQARAFIEETPSTLSEYLSLLRSERGKLLTERGSLSDHASVTMTFKLAFEQTTANSPEAADLIRLCAFLAPDAIPEELFPESKNPYEFTKILKQACRFSLIDRDPHTSTLDVHRLVQIVIQDQMSKDDQCNWAERAVRAVNSVFPEPKFENWGSCQQLQSHALACANWIDKFVFAFEEAAYLLNRIAGYLYHRALYAQAESLFQRALAIYENMLEPNNPVIAEILSNLANAFTAQAKYAQAEPLYYRSVAIVEKTFGPNHPDLAFSLNSLAHCFHKQDRYSEAKPFYQRSLAIRENMPNPDHPVIATCLNNLASLYREEGKYAEAEPLLLRALSIREKELGSNHPDTANSLHSLAALYYYQREFLEAEPLLARAVAIYKKTLGPKHDRTQEARPSLQLTRAALRDAQP